MSSQPSGNPAAPKEEKDKKRLSKFFSRAKEALKRGESSKRSSAIASKAQAASKPEPVKTYVS